VITTNDELKMALKGFKKIVFSISCAKKGGKFITFPLFGLFLGISTWAALVGWKKLSGFFECLVKAVCSWCRKYHGWGVWHFLRGQCSCSKECSMQGVVQLCKKAGGRRHNFLQIDDFFFVPEVIFFLGACMVSFCQDSGFRIQARLRSKRQ